LSAGGPRSELGAASTWIVSPVIQRASGDTRNATASAMSSGWAIRFSVCSQTCSRGPHPSWRRTTCPLPRRRPTALTRTPRARAPRQMLDQRVRSRPWSRHRPASCDHGMRREQREQYDAAALMKDGLQLLHKEERRADIDGKQIVEILDRRFLDDRRLRHAGVGDEDVERSPTMARTCRASL